MLSEEESKIACDELNEMIVENKYHLNTGFLSTHELLRVLTDYGHVETAYKLLFQDTQPSWLYQLEYDATTIWENWDAMAEGKKPTGSMNHYSFGTFAGWLMDRAAGITVNQREIKIQPYPISKLDYVDASYDSPVGKVKVFWEIKEDKFNLIVNIPSNTKAEIIMPDGARCFVLPGEHKFNCNY